MKVKYHVQGSSPKVLLRPITMLNCKKFQLVITQLVDPYIKVSIEILSSIIGRATHTPLIRKGSKEPSLKTLIARRGIHPTGDVFLIMKEIVIRAVNMTVFIVNLFF